MLFALEPYQLGVSSFAINTILLSSIVILLILPTLFLIRSAQGKSAF